MKSRQSLPRPTLDEDIRKKLMMQKSEFAAMIKVSAATVSKWLYTKAEPNSHTLRCIARDFGLSNKEVEEMYEGVE